MVTFYNESGTVLGMEILDYGARVTVSVSTEREGYTFLGWFIDEGGQNAWDPDTGLGAANLDLYGQWRETAAPKSGGCAGISPADTGFLLFGTACVLAAAALLKTAFGQKAKKRRAGKCADCT
jgi:uncharacterized repeat protein (TIGR02543 family)